MFPLGCLLQERQLGVGVCPGKDSEAGEWTGAQVLWGAGIVWPERRGKVGGGIVALSLT